MFTFFINIFLSLYYNNFMSYFFIYFFLSFIYPLPYSSEGKSETFYERYFFQNDIIKKTDGTFYTKKLENCCLVKDENGEWFKTTYTSPNGTRYTMTTTYIGGPVGKPKKKENDTLSSLKKELEISVEKQDFEKAAELRDQIKKMETNKTEIDKLESELKMAVNKQEFEEAIKLRDKIKELKS